MPNRTVLCTGLMVALLAAPAFAQDMKPAPSTPTPPVTSTPLTAPKPSTTGAATAPVATKINLNTATAAELDKLPKIGPVHAKAIMDARAKSNSRTGMISPRERSCRPKQPQRSRVSRRSDYPQSLCPHKAGHKRRKLRIVGAG